MMPAGLNLPLRIVWWLRDPKRKRSASAAQAQRKRSAENDKTVSSV
jgi:hypothetical protein